MDAATFIEIRHYLVFRYSYKRPDDTPNTAKPGEYPKTLHLLLTQKYPYKRV